jgi:hypothetical protein
MRIQDVKNKLRELKVIDGHSHLRFLDKIKGEKVWLDITNDEVECPSNSDGVVDIKIVQQFHECSQAFLSDVFEGIAEDQYEQAILRLRAILNIQEGPSGETPTSREKDPSSTSRNIQQRGKNQNKQKTKDEFKMDMDSGYMEFKDVEEEVDEFGNEEQGGKFLFHPILGFMNEIS